jgi:hypothetical protein
MTAPATDLRVLDPALAARFRVVRIYGGGEGWSAAVLPRQGGGGPWFLKILDLGVEVREASLLASLRHPSIPRVLEVGRTESGRAYLLREHIDGVALAEQLPLDAALVRELAVQLLEVLAYVHWRGILHLDV